MKIISIAIVVIISVWYSGYGSELTGDILYQMPGGQTIEAELKARGFAHFMKHSTIVACLQGKAIDSNELLQTIQDCKIEYAHKYPEASQLISGKVEDHLISNLKKIAVSLHIIFYA